MKIKYLPFIFQLIFLTIIISLKCANEAENPVGENGGSSALIETITLRQDMDRIEITGRGEPLSGNTLGPEATGVTPGITISGCTAVQTGGKWRTCCDLQITNNTGVDISGVVLIGWQALSGLPEAARTGGNNTGYDGSGTGWRTTDGVNPNPSANGGWALWLKGATAGTISNGDTSASRRICLQSPTGYSTSLWYFYKDCPSGKVVNANNYAGLTGWAMLGDEINDPNYPDLGSGNYVLTDPDGYYAFPEITATSFIENAGANCFNNMRVVTTDVFIYMPLTPSCREAYVANDDVTDSILVFDHTQSGNVPPIRVIQGASTLLSNPHRATGDTVNNEIVVANTGNNSISFFPRLANGNVAPLRTITGPATNLNKPEDVIVDTIHDEIFVANKGSDAILVFSRTDNGNIAPSRTLSGANTKLNRPRGVAVDYVNNEISVANDGTNSILIFSRTANGNVAPLREIIGPATGLSKPRRLAVDPINEEIIVPEQSTNSVLVFPRLANGDVAPLRTITGPATTLSNLEGLAVDTVFNEIIVGNKGDLSIAVFSRTANGNVAPLRSIKGPLTLITKPFGTGVGY